MQAAFTAEIAVCSRGYGWIAAGNGDADAVVCPIEDTGGATRRVYDPFKDEPALFHTLAHLDPEPDTIRDYAGRYGLLWPEEHTDAQPKNTLDCWRREIAWMRWAVEMWGALQIRKGETFQKFVTQPDPKHVVPMLPREIIDICLDPILPVPLQVQTRTGKITRKAGVQLLDRLLALRTGMPRYSILIQHPAGGAAVVQVHVADLADVLWLQLAHVVFGEVELRTCDRCGAPFILRQETRNDRVFCTPACKRMGVYERKREAQRMRAAGKTLRDITRAVGAPSKTYRQNLATVKRWLGEK